MDPKGPGSYDRAGLRQGKGLQVTDEEPHRRQWAKRCLVASGIGSEETCGRLWKCWGVGWDEKNVLDEGESAIYPSCLLYISSIGSLFTDYLQ